LYIYIFVVQNTSPMKKISKYFSEAYFCFKLYIVRKKISKYNTLYFFVIKYIIHCKINEKKVKKEKYLNLKKPFKMLEKCIYKLNLRIKNVYKL